MDKITAFLDTSSFIKENFTSSYQFKRLLELAAKDKINLIITDIVYGEILSNQAKQLDEAMKAMQNTYRIRNKQGRVLRCYDDLQTLFEIPELDKEKLINRFKKDFDGIIEKAHIRIISSKNTKVDYVFDRYFAQKPPFSEKKKDEFPDAFSVKTITEYIKSNKIKKFYIVSQDSDLYVEEVKKNTFYKEIEELVSEYVRQENKHTKALSLIDKMYKEKREWVSPFEDEIENLFESYIYSGKYNPNVNREIESIDNIEISEIEFAENYNIIEIIEERFAIIATSVTIVYGVEYTYNDYDSACYDKEDSKWFFLEQETDKVRDVKKFPITVEIDYNPPAGPGLGQAKIIELDLSIL